MPVGEKVLRVGMQVVPLRPEVVVDDVQKDHETAGVGCVDQPFEVLRAAVAGVRREGQHAVIAPVAGAREVGERHQLDGRDAEIDEMVQLLPHAVVGAGRREAADVELVENRFLPGPSRPVTVLPVVGERVDDLARSVDVVGLKPGRGIRHPELAVDPEAVAVAGGRVFGLESEPAVSLRGHRQLGAALHDQVHPPCRRCPQAESDAAVIGRLRAEGHPVSSARHDSPARSAAVVKWT